MVCKNITELGWDWNVLLSMKMLLFRIKTNAIFTENVNSGYCKSETFSKGKKVNNI